MNVKFLPLAAALCFAGCDDAADKSDENQTEAEQ